MEIRVIVYSFIMLYGVCLLFRFNEKTNFKLVMIGFEGAGKATIDYQLRILHNMSFVYNCNGSTTFTYKGIVVDLFTLELLDVVHDNTLNIYLNDTDGIILVIDSNDKEKFEKNK